MSIFRRIGQSIAKNFVRQSMPDLVRTGIERELDKRLPAIIEDILIDRFKNKPDDPLTAAGFNWALALSLRAIWPDVSNAEAVRWLLDYIEVPYGTAGYEWTAAAAKLIATEYVNEVGEVA